MVNYFISIISQKQEKANRSRKEGVANKYSMNHDGGCFFVNKK
jgi:hypothetical protein